MKFSKKYRALIKHNGRFDILEGTTYSGKTTVGAGVKFMLEIAKSNKRFHGIAGKDLGTIEKNIINSEVGILAEWGDYVQYKGGGTTDTKLPHIIFRQEDGSTKIIYVFGYDDKSRWQKVLGGQLGCLYVDEANIADIDFIREASIRCDYMLWTLNPDNPDLQIYKEYINHARPLQEHEKDYPSELLEQLNEEPKDGYAHWYFTFEDNIACTPEKRQQIVSNAPVGTKIYKNKILGLRGRATGLVFDLQPKHIVEAAVVKQKIAAGEIKFIKYFCGVDTSYSKKTRDKIVYIFGGITDDRKLYVLDEFAINNRDRVVPWATSDVPPSLVRFLEKNRLEWGFGRHAFIDCADSGTIMECEKYKRQNGCVYLFEPSWKGEIINRINSMIGWMTQDCFYVLSHCKNLISEFNSYSWKEDKDEPESGNDHSINAMQYGYLPFADKIGNYAQE